VGQLSIPGSSYSFPASIKLVNEGGEFFAFVQSAFPAHVYRLAFGESIVDLTGTFTNLGNFGISNDNGAFELIGYSSSWRGFSIDLSGTVPGAGRLFRFNFPESCSTPVRTFDTETPPSFTFSNDGSYRVTLKATDAGGNMGYHSKIVSVASGISPDIDIMAQNMCSGYPVQFTSINASSNIVSYQWDFGDFNTSDQQHPSHIFTSAGRYNVKLNVLGSNGCGNAVQKEVEIFNEPLADFETPGTSPICTNQVYQFFNTTVFDAGLDPSWEWSVNGTTVSADYNFETMFSNPESQTIKLTASIPGCVNEIEKILSAVSEGPLVDFSFSGQCQDTPVSFTNATTGSVNGYSWNFGDGQNSTNEDPQNSFASPGTFDVTLTAFGSSGCNNTKTKPVTIYSKPLTDFSVALPPFSCSGTPTQFTDITPNPFDSNLASWQWNFGDGSGSSTARNPQYTFQNAGDYSVSFTATTNFGCSSTIQKPVLISQSPVASFTNSPPCLGVPVNFTNTSTGSLQSQQWQIQSSFYTVANPVHAFLTSGDKNVTLNVTATNGCIASVSRTLNVPAVLTPDFSVSRNCINQQTEFTDITNDAADPVVAYAWNFAGLGSGTENPQVFSFSNTGSFNVSLSVTTQTGCVHSTAKNVSIINSPQAGFTATPAFGPPPLQVQFTNTSTNATHYRWEFNDPNGASSTSVSPSFTFEELGSYDVDLTAFNAQGCLSLFSRRVEVVIPFTDVALIQFELMEAGQGAVRPAVTIQNKGNIAVVNLPLTFEVDGTAFRTFVTTSIPPNSSYYYVSDFELPASSALTYVCVLAGIDDISPDDNQLCASVDQPVVVLSLHPNPATAQSHIEVQWIVRENRSVEVFLINSIGQTVYSEKVNSISGLNTFRLPATGFQGGLYFLQVRSGDFSRTHRLVVLE
jgi:PKD repeat protein